MSLAEDLLKVDLTLEECEIVIPNTTSANAFSPTDSVYQSDDRQEDMSPVYAANLRRDPDIRISENDSGLTSDEEHLKVNANINSISILCEKKKNANSSVDMIGYDNVITELETNSENVQTNDDYNNLSASTLCDETNSEHLITEEPVGKESDSNLCETEVNNDNITVTESILEENTGSPKQLDDQEEQIHSRPSEICSDLNVDQIANEDSSNEPCSSNSSFPSVNVNNLEESSNSNEEIPPNNSSSKVIFSTSVPSALKKDSGRLISFDGEDSSDEDVNSEERQPNLNNSKVLFQTKSIKESTKTVSVRLKDHNSTKRRPNLTCSLPLASLKDTSILIKHKTNDKSKLVNNQPVSNNTMEDRSHFTVNNSRNSDGDNRTKTVTFSDIIRIDGETLVQRGKSVYYRPIMTPRLFPNYTIMDKKTYHKAQSNYNPFASLSSNPTNRYDTSSVYTRTQMPQTGSHTPVYNPALLNHSNIKHRQPYRRNQNTSPIIKPSNIGK